MQRPIKHSEPQASATRSLARTSLGFVLLMTVVAVGFLPRTASALAFEPSESEWATWPAYCQARYTVSGAGSDSPFADRVSPAAVASWESRLGADVWTPLHHYCAGLILAVRAKSNPDKRQRESGLRRVIEEYSFTLRGIDDPSPMRAEIGARRGMIFADMGDSDAALRDFDTAISDCPKCAVGYQAKAMFFRNQGKLASAQEVLDAGNRATDGQSAELQYFLGIVLADMKDFAKAQEHGRKAYELGYPLPALRDRLAKAGHPID